MLKFTSHLVFLLFHSLIFYSHNSLLTITFIFKLLNYNIDILIVMKLFKFLFGIVLAQIATVTLIVLSPTALDTTGILRLAVPLLFIALVIAFWFSSLATQDGKDRFASEKEKIRADAERDKERIIKEAQRNITLESTKTHAKANFKVGAAFAGVLGVGALFVFAQMMTAALLTITAAGGAATGYFYRGKRLTRREAELKQLEVIDVKAIETKSK